MAMHKLKAFAFLCCVTIISVTSFAQQPDMPANKSYNLRNLANSIKPKENITDLTVYTSVTKISFSSYFILLGDDFKQQITAPFHQTGKAWKNVGIYAASITAFSVAFDEPIQKWVLDLSNNSKTVSGHKWVCNKIWRPVSNLYIKCIRCLCVFVS